MAVIHAIAPYTISIILV